MGRARDQARRWRRRRRRKDPDAPRLHLTPARKDRNDATPRLEGLTAVVLAGGRGTRLGPLSADVPKPLIRVAGRPFLDWVARWLIDQGVVDTVYSAGHLGDQVERWVDELRLPEGHRARCRSEPSPLGTGGAVLACLDLCDDLVLIANGDTLLLADLTSTIERLLAEALEGVLLAVRVGDASRFGTVDVGEDGLLRSFREKEPGAGLVNGGLYLFRRAALERFLPVRPMSLERDVIPSLLLAGARMGVVVVDAPFLDIGVPGSLATADAFVAAQIRGSRTPEGK